MRLQDNGNRLVYGGSDEGLMAVIADAVLATRRRGDRHRGADVRGPRRGAP